MSTEPMTYEAIARLALNLPPADKLRLIERLAFRLGYDLDTRPPAPRRSSHWALANLGPAPSAEDIADARRDMWSGGRGDAAP